jgi:periplasmic protein TonB
MSLDLFRPATVHPHSPRGTPLVVIPLSIAAHMAALVVLVVIPLTAADVLPTPREMLVIMQAGAPPPVPPVPVMPVSRVPARVIQAQTAPLAAPAEVGRETGLQVLPDVRLADQASSAGVVPGAVDGGLPGVLDRPPAPPPPPAAPFPVGGDVTAPRKVYDVRPQYPALAMQARVEGVVIIQAIIGTTGVVEEATILRSVPLLDEVALVAVRQWRFTPTRLNGVPISVSMTVTVNFTLRPPKP